MTPEDADRLMPGVLSLAMWREIAEQYNSNDRHYHTFDHVSEVLNHFSDARRAVGWRHPNEHFLALVFHDLVYEPALPPGDSEMLSARAARLVLADYAFANAVEVGRLIRLTAQIFKVDRSTLSTDEAMFLDCDQAILGADEDTYEAYVTNLHAEFTPVWGSTKFYNRRIVYLRTLLTRATPIFFSDYFRERYEARARSNLGEELARLERRAFKRQEKEEG